MSTYFCRSAASGTGDGSSWTNAFTTLSAAGSTAVGGDRIWLADDHAETGTGTNTIVFSSSGAPVQVLCADHTQASPGSGDLKTSGTVTTTSTGVMNLLGRAYIYGVTFSNGSGSSNTSLTIGGTSSNQFFRFDNCVLKLATTLSGASIRIGTQSAGNSSRVELVNTNFVFASTGQYLRMDGSLFTMRGGSIAATGSVPATVFNTLSSMGGVISLDGVDLSACTGTIFGSDAEARQCLMKDCRLNASATIATAPAQLYSSLIDYIRCDSGGNVYQSGRYRYEGTQSVDTTVYRSGGASDGTTPLSAKIVTNSGAAFSSPFDSIPMVVRNTTTGGAVTVTIYGTSATLPTNADIWIRVASLSTSSSTLATFTDSGPANILATGTSLTTDGSGWTGAAASTWKISVTVTPQIAGDLYVVVRAAKASATFWIDPKPVLS